MRLKEKIVRTPSVYSMTDADVFGVFFWCCVDDDHGLNVTVDDEEALDEFERGFFSWSYVRNDQYLPHSPADNDDYVAYLLFWAGCATDRPGYVFQVSAEGEGLRCVLYETEYVDACRTEYHRVCTWKVPPADLEVLFKSNDDKDKE